MDYQSGNYQKEQAKPKELGESELNEPITTQDATTCHHKFIMKGKSSMQCVATCGVGYVISGYEDYKRISEYYANKYKG